MNENNKVKPSFDGLGILLLIVAVYIAVPIVGANIIYRLTPLDETSSTLLGNALTSIVLILMFGKMLINKVKEYFSDKKYIKTSLKYWAIGFGLMYLFNIIIVIFIVGDIAANEELNRAILKAYPFLSFFEMCLVAPFVEEMVFRFGLRQFVGKNKFFPWISAFLFGFVHIIADLSSPLSLLYILPYGALGLMFAKAYDKTDNIVTSSICHIIHNTLCYIIILLFA